MGRKTKIVVTLGPASASPDVIEKLIQAGADVFRLNFSHGDHTSHEQMIDTIRSIASEKNVSIGILQDLGGPKIRLGTLNKDPFFLQSGTLVRLFPGTKSNYDMLLPVQYDYLLDDISEGDLILMADGAIEMLVEKKGTEFLLARVTVGGIIRSHKGVNLPSSTLRIQSFTHKDREDLSFGLKKKIDFVALSFIRHEQDLTPVMEMISQSDNRPAIIAKIEKPQAVDRIGQILDKVDGVMVARGDLGVEMPLERVPILQKSIIQAARHRAKPVITATQMLGSMTENPRPTRAETTDVANAILDGTDALMLSDETAMGRYPVEAVEVMDRIARETERHFEKFFRRAKRYDLDSLDKEQIESQGDGIIRINEAIGRSACVMAEELEAVAIIASTASGTTARLVSRFRPQAPVIAITHDASTYRNLALSWGVFPILVEPLNSTDEMFDVARNWVTTQGLAHAGDILVITAGAPVGMRGTTNLVKVVTVA